MLEMPSTPVGGENRFMKESFRSPYEMHIFLATPARDTVYRVDRLFWPFGFCNADTTITARDMEWIL
jgi:hypothetical protein